MTNIDFNTSSYPLSSQSSRAEGVFRSAKEIYDRGDKPDRADRAEGAKVDRGPDRTDISPAAHTLASIPSLPDPRPDVVQGIREQIASGAYEGEAFDKKIDAAIEAILDEVSAGL